MKIDKDFAVKVEGRVFTANDISSISIDITWFKMKCMSKNGTKFTVEASLKDVEFLSIPNIPEFKRTIDRDKTPNTYNQFVNSYCKVGDEPKSDIEVVAPLSEKMKESTREVIKSMDKDSKTFKVTLCDEPTIRETKSNIFGEAMSAQEITTSFQNMHKALIEALKSIKENQTLNCEIKVDGKDFVKLFKKYNHTGGD